MAGGSIGMSGHSFDAFVSSQRTFNEYDLAAKIQEKYWRARQKFLAKIEKKEDSYIVLSDSKLDAKIEIYRSIDNSCAKLTNILESYQNSLYIYANEENSLGLLLKECSKHDKTKAGKIMALASKSLTQSSHQTIRLYMPLLRIYQEMETFHSHAVEDTSSTVKNLENKRSQYRASLLWMKDISEKLDPELYGQLDKFRRVQNQVRNDKKAFDGLQLDVVQKIDLLMASRCNLMNQILASYQSTLLETFEKNCDTFKSIEELIRKEDIYEYEFKALKQLNPLRIDDEQAQLGEDLEAIETAQEAQPETEEMNNNDAAALIDVSPDNSDCGEETRVDDNKKQADLISGFDEEESDLDSLEKLFANIAKPSSADSRFKPIEGFDVDKGEQNPEKSTDLMSKFEEKEANMDELERLFGISMPSTSDTTPIDLLL